MRLSRAETADRRAEVIARRDTVIRAYSSGRSTARVADDWEVGRSWLEDRLREWGVPLRGPVRVAVLLLDAADRVVLVRSATPTADRRQGWRLPGGWTREQELVTCAAARELRRETGLVRTHPQLVAAGFDILPSDAAADLAGGRRIVFAGSALTAAEAKSLAVPDGIAALIPVTELAAHTRPFDTRRIRTTLTATGRAAAL